MTHRDYIQGPYAFPSGSRKYYLLLAMHGDAYKWCACELKLSSSSLTPYSFEHRDESDSCALIHVFSIV